MKAVCKKPTDAPKTLIKNRFYPPYKTYKVETGNGYPLIVEFYKSAGLLKTECNFWLSTTAAVNRTKTRRCICAMGGGTAYCSQSDNPQSTREPAALIFALANGGITLSDAIKSDRLDEKNFIPDAIAAIAKRFDFGRFRIIVEHE